MNPLNLLINLFVLVIIFITTIIYILSKYPWILYLIIAFFVLCVLLAIFFSNEEETKPKIKENKNTYYCPKTNFIRGYYRRDGKYVRSYFRRPRR